MVQFCSLRIYFGIKTVSCLLLQQMTRIDVDLNLKIGPTFSSFNAMHAKTTKKNIMISAS